jgi:hypothetical protein
MVFLPNLHSRQTQEKTQHSRIIWGPKTSEWIPTLRRGEAIRVTARIGSCRDIMQNLRICILQPSCQ